MKVLGIVGGSKGNGNTVKLVEEVLAGAREAGHETILFKLAEMRIGHIGDRGGEVTFPKDDFNDIMPHIESMGALVLGAPNLVQHSRLTHPRLHPTPLLL